MKFIKDIQKYTERINKRKTVLMSLATIVVFITTYMLVLPAITLEQDEAEKQGGIDLPKSEQSVDKQDQAASDDSKDAEAKKEDVKDKDASADQDAKKDEAKTEDKTDSAKDEQSSSDSAKAGLAFEGEGYSITAKAGSDAKLPEDTKLTAKEVKSDEKKYDALCKEAEKALNDSPLVKDDVSVKSAKFYDITLQSDGKEVEPAADVNVKITYDKSLKMSKSGDVYVIHFAEDKNGKMKPEVLKDSAVDVKSKAGSKSGTIEVSDVAFDASGFSMYGVLETSTLEETVVTADGKNYKVSVTYDADAKVPEGAKLAVSEIGSDDSKYDDYVAKSEKALDMDKGSAGYARLFDIKIVDKDGNKVKIQAPVDVKIELADKEDKEKTKVVHFADGSEKGDVVEDVKVDGKNISFAAEGFSVYAVVDEGDQTAHARMTVKFYGKDQSNEITEVYVKNGDSLEELKAILYDPGAGELGDGDLFMGWTFNKDYTADIANTPYDPTDAPNGLMTIDNVREWAADKTIQEGETVNLYAVVLRHHTVTYLDDEDISLGSESAYYREGDASSAFTINRTYTPQDDTHSYEGWNVKEGASNIVSATYGGQSASAPYKTDTVINITGDVTLKVYLEEGNWLVFDENGKGGTYNAPQFVKTDEVTHKPIPDEQMTRYGYTFAGWYEDAAGTQPFVFERTLNTKKTIYAKWTPNTTAPYTVVCWTQNQDRTAYDVAGTYSGTGTVGQPIPFTIVPNGDEDYVNGVGANNGHYTGFDLVHTGNNLYKTTGYNNNTPVREAVAVPTVTPEGDAVLNLYYDRIVYNMKIYLYRQNGNGNNSYSYAENSNRGKNTWGIATWYRETDRNSMPTTTYPGGIQKDTQAIDGYYGYYILLSAYYGEDISSKWPKYSQISSPANNRSPVSFVMMNGTGLKGNGLNDNGYGTGKDTIKGLITIMDEKILGKTNDANGNFLIVRFNTYNNWRYHIWYETVPGQTYPPDTTRPYNGKTYYEITDSPIEVRSSNTDVDQQNPPQYMGFDYVARRNENWNGDGRWTSGNNPTLYHINYLYDRKTYKITYLDGVYVNGNNQVLKTNPTYEFKQSDAIEHGATIPSGDRDYIPTLPAGETGYVFEGWYLDEACTIPYEWGTMPIGGITVHAKWRQVQYRVFLHPQAGTSETDPSLSWGSATQQMNFRVDYNKTVSTPTGTRDGYEFIGWYTTPNGTPKTMFNGQDTKLNEQLSALADYDKTTDLTDPMDQWGNGAETNADTDRPWITQKLDLYAKWRQILSDAEGINVEYDANGGSNAPTDKTLYLDAAFAVAQAAPTPPDGKQFNCWVMQRWDPDGGADGNGAYVDVEPLSIYSPGEQFEVKMDYAKKEEAEGSTSDNPKYKYTVRLRADYIDPGDETQTFIHFFANVQDKDGNPIPDVTPYDPDAGTGNEPKDITTYHNNIKINEAVDILTIGSVLGSDASLYNGYKFIGWAKSRDASEPWLKLNSDGTTYTVVQDSQTYSSVEKIAADEAKPYEDLYAVWEKKTYTVKVVKVVDGSADDKKIPFDFTQSGIPNGDTSFKLVGSTVPVTVDGHTYTNEKEYQTVPYQTKLTVTEAAADGFTTSVKYTCTDADDTTKNVENQTISNGQELTVDGNITITVTNSKKTIPIKVVKIDQDGAALEGATFKFDGKDFAGNNNTSWTSTMDGNDAVIVKSESVPFGTYTLNETGVPAGFYPVEGSVTITVSAGNSGDVVIDVGPSAFVTKELVDVNHPELGYVVKIMNTAGVELPSTGGPGTTWIYLLGTVLLLVCGITLIARRRIRSN